jgi:protein-tyrosine phosphatase
MQPRAPRTLAALALAATAACFTVDDRITVQPDATVRPVVDRLGDDRVRLRWPAPMAQGACTVFAGHSPGAIDYSRPLATASSPIELTTDILPEIEDERARLYYAMVSADDRTFVTAERRLPLEGPDNFRDLGGYATVDGRFTRWGRLYRSGDHASLTEADILYLSRLGIQLVCDLRSTREREGSSDLSFDDHAENIHIEVDPEGVQPEIIQNKIRRGLLDREALEVMMTEAYRSFPNDYADEWALLFKRLAEPRSLPAVVHCTAGKDRTGFASALVLRAVGVPEETVFEDYLLTNHYRARHTRIVSRLIPVYSLWRSDPEDLLPLLEAREEYLRASFDEIERRWGSLDVYLKKGLGVTPGMRAALRRNLTKRP